MRQADAGAEDARQPTDAGMPTPDACVQQVSQLLVNPAFDASPPGQGWQQTLIAADVALITGEDGVVEHTPPLKAWLGGLAAPAFTTITDGLSQQVVVPAHTMQLVLSGVYDVRTDETTTIAYDTAKLIVTDEQNSTIATVLSLSNLTPKTAWTNFAYAFPQDLSGKKIRIKLTSTNDDINVTSFFFDSFTLTAIHSCQGGQ